MKHMLTKIRFKLMLRSGSAQDFTVWAGLILWGIVEANVDE